jgi:hypothetical protein
MELLKKGCRHTIVAGIPASCLLVVFASTASATTITTGHMLLPIISSSSFEEVTLPLPTFSLIHTYSLPTGYTYTTGQETSVIVRSSDHHIFTNVLDKTSGTAVSAILELDASGAFVAVKDQSVATGGNFEQLVFDPSDPTLSTVLSSVSGLTTHEVDAVNPHLGTQTTKFSLAGADFKGLAIDAIGNIYAADDTTGKVEKYSSAGAFIADFTTAASDHTLTGMTFDAAANLYVGQFTDSDILKYSSLGAFLAAYSSFVDLPPGVFYNPGDSLLYAPAGGSDFVVQMKTDGTSATFTTITSTSGIGIPTIVPALVPVTVPEPAPAVACGGALLLALLLRRLRAHREGKIEILD